MDAPAPLDEADIVTGGFADPVFDAQAVFSGVMRALSEPGVCVDLGARVSAPAPLAPAAAAILAALADEDTPVWLDEALRAAPGVAGWIGFQTGAPTTQEPGRAAFAATTPGADGPDLAGFAVGTAEDPDRSTTLILAVAALDGGPPLRLAGPGIEREATVAPLGLGSGFIEAFAANRALFPRGVDVILVAGRHAIGLPRTTRIGST